MQIFLWLGIEEYEPYLFRQLPGGFELPSLPLKLDEKHLQYQSSFSILLLPIFVFVFRLGRLFFELRCYCCKARSLIASDDTGLSDPYLSITVANETQTTPVEMIVETRLFFSVGRLDSQTLSVSSMEHDVSLSESDARR